MSAVFHFCICIFERIKERIPLSPELAKFCVLFISGAISSLPMSLLNSTEQNLLKLFFFPLAFRCFFDKMLELGFMPRLKGGDIISYVLASSVIGYVWTYEKYSDSLSMSKAVDMYTQFSRN